MEETKDFWEQINDLLKIGVSGYGTYKATTYIDTLLSFIPLGFFLIFLYLILKRK